MRAWTFSPRARKGDAMDEQPARHAEKHEQAVFGAGCFWCAEAVFQQLNGVLAVVSGYSGGAVESPSYEQICSGDDGACRGRTNQLRSEM